MTRTEERPINRPRAILFDWDNTLVDSWTTIHEALEETFAAMGHQPWTLEETRVRVRHSMRESFPALFRERWEEAAQVFYQAYEKFHLERLVAVTGAGSMLRELYGSACLGVVSNKTGRYLRAEAVHLGWDRFFHRVVGAGDAARDKPAEDPVHLVLEGSRIPPGPEVWFVGDAGIDMEIAHRTGCVAILLNADQPGAAEFSRFPPRLRFKSCRELAEYVAKL